LLWIQEILPQSFWMPWMTSIGKFKYNSLLFFSLFFFQNLLFFEFSWLCCLGPRSTIILRTTSLLNCFAFVSLEK
jgi:hypothetical protein